MNKTLFLLLAAIVLAACASSPDGRVCPYVDSNGNPACVKGEAATWPVRP